jgi:N-methylhydantoinase A
MGQGFEINVQVQEMDLSDSGVEVLKSRFHEEYKRNYGYAEEGAEIEIVTLKLIATCLRPQFKLQALRGRSKREDPKKGTREIYLHETKGFRSCPIYDREKLYPGFTIQGPAIVEETTSSTVVLPGDLVEVDEFGNLLVTLE